MGDITNNELLTAMMQMIDKRLSESEKLLLSEDAKLYNYMAKRFDQIELRLDAVESEVRANKLAIESIQLNKELEIRAIK